MIGKVKSPKQSLSATPEQKAFGDLEGAHQFAGAHPSGQAPRIDNL